jgi:hypothetical protein
MNHNERVQEKGTKEPNRERKAKILNETEPLNIAVFQKKKYIK